jgi:hypothetical protein
MYPEDAIVNIETFRENDEFKPISRTSVLNDCTAMINNAME